MASVPQFSFDLSPRRKGSVPLHDADQLLAIVIAEARALKIPVSDRISPHVTMNIRAVSRFGCCMKRGDSFTIEVAAKLLSAPELSCRQTLAHEVLHTCYGCKNHGARWKAYAALMNQAYGYQISRTGTHEALGIRNEAPVRYLLTCQRCGMEIRRMRKSRLTEHPERYRCRCGGTLKRRPC